MFVLTIKRLSLLTAEPADSTLLLELPVRVGTVTVPVTFVNPVEIKTAPAQLEEYSTLL
jgi:hypothetical protein